MFMPNDVYGTPDGKIRVLWSSGPLVAYCWIEGEKTGPPELRPRAGLEHLMAVGGLSAADDPHAKLAMTAPPPGSAAAKQADRAWGVVKDLVGEEPAIYRRRERGELIRRAMEKHGVRSRQTVYRWLYRYWRFGKCRNALAGRYGNCGAPGVSRENPGAAKRGRKRTVTPGVGVNVDARAKRIFRAALDKHYLNRKEFTFDHAYNEVLIAYGVPLPCEAGDLNDVPTIEQFRYFFKKEHHPPEVAKRRKGEANHAKDDRPLLNTSTAEVAGPGSRYQIDATVADAYLVSEQDPGRIICRPTLYFVVDVFSRAIVGMHVGLEPASWAAAASALGNAVRDKVAYCAGFGVEIEPRDWPMSGLPEVVLGDRGEMLSRQVETLCHAFNVEIENTPPHRPDWKGVVERKFKTVQTAMKPFTPGYVDNKPRGRKRQGTDPRVGARLTLREFTRMLILIVLHYNNHHALSSYDPDGDMPADLPHVPADLWDWGIENRTGRLRAAPDAELLRVNLLPHTEAAVTRNGLRLFHCDYTCQRGAAEDWFDRNFKGPETLEVAYDPLSVNEVYIRPPGPDPQPVVATLTASSRQYRDLTLAEVRERRKTLRETAGGAKAGQRAASVNLARELREIQKKAEAERPPDPGLGKAARIRGIRDNTKSERKHEERKRADARGADSGPPRRAEVVPIRKDPGPRADFAVPGNLSELLRMGPDDE